MSVMEFDSTSTGEWEAFIGAQVRQLRLRSQLDQQTFAAQAGISATALKKLEGGKGVTLATLVKAVRSLGKTDWFEALAPPISVSPMQMLKTARKLPRQRAPRRQKKHPEG